MQPNNRFYRVVTKAGEEVTGRLLNHDTYTVQLLDLDERLRSFRRADLREHGFDETPMPSYRRELSDAGDRGFGCLSSLAARQAQ